MTVYDIPAPHTPQVGDAVTYVDLMGNEYPALVKTAHTYPQEDTLDLYVFYWYEGDALGANLRTNVGPRITVYNHISSQGGLNGLESWELRAETLMLDELRDEVALLKAQVAQMREERTVATDLLERCTRALNRNNL